MVLMCEVVIKVVGIVFLVFIDSYLKFKMPHRSQEHEAMF